MRCTIKFPKGPAVTCEELYSIIWENLYCWTNSTHFVDLYTCISLRKDNENLNWPSLPTIISSTIENAYKCWLIGVFLCLMFSIYSPPFCTRTQQSSLESWSALKLIEATRMCTQTLEHLIQQPHSDRL